LTDSSAVYIISLLNSLSTSHQKIGFDDIQDQWNLINTHPKQQVWTL